MDAIMEGDPAGAAKIAAEIRDEHGRTAQTPQAFSDALRAASTGDRERFFKQLEKLEEEPEVKEAYTRKFPKRLRHGDYTATFEGIQNERFLGDPTASARWKITRRGKEVGSMHEGHGYGWGRPTTTLRQLVWGGAMPAGESDSRTSEYGIGFDQGPTDSHAAALAQFARAADRLIAWREKHGHPWIGHKPLRRTK